MRSGSILLLAALLAVSGCGRESQEPRPWFLLVVIDTLRADAVSAYGQVEGTTPAFDRLAAAGLLYTRAFAPSPWTLPSHASLLSGLEIDRHRVGVEGRMALSEGVVTLAERLREAGYRTAAFSENPLISAPFGMLQGFEEVASQTVVQLAAEAVGLGSSGFDVVKAIRSWLETSRDGRPVFLFVNLFDPHDPYRIRAENPFLPSGSSAEQARNVQHRGRGLCSRLPPSADLAILRGLYLGEVAAADRKLESIYQLVRAARRRGALVTVVTSDHGEHLGEHRILGHEFSLRNVLLKVPLAVHGLPGAAPSSIDEPVALVDVAASILRWAGADAALESAILPVEEAETSASRDLVAYYSDHRLQNPEALPSAIQVDSDAPDLRRAGCSAEDRVFGEMISLTRFPYKLIWYEHHASQLYDLSWDPGERSDISAHHSDLTQQLAARVGEFRDVSLRGEASAVEQPFAPKPEAIEALRALGYLE